MIITKAFEFDSAHNLVNYMGKCEKLHGHTYRLEVSLEGKPNNEGIVFDFVEMKKIIEEKVVDKLDHTYINDTIKQPSAENIAIWVWNQLNSLFGDIILHEVKVFESKESWVTYRGEHE